MKLPINRLRVGVVLAVAVALAGIGAPALASAATTSTSDAYCRQHYYAYGSTGYCVKDIQNLFNLDKQYNWCGMSDSYTDLIVDGKYGIKTANAIKYLQTKCRIHVDGIVGPQTWGYLIAFD